MMCSKEEGSILEGMQGDGVTDVMVGGGGVEGEVRFIVVVIHEGLHLGGECCISKW